MGTILVGKMSKNIKTIKTIQFSQLIGAFKKKENIYREEKKSIFQNIQECYFLL